MATDTHKEDWRDFPGAVIPVKGKDGVTRLEAWPSEQLRSAPLPEAYHPRNVKAFLEDQFPCEPEKKVLRLMEVGKEAAELLTRDEVDRLIERLHEKMLAKARARR